MKTMISQLSVFCILLTGCSRNDGNTPDPVPPVQDSTYVAMLVMTSTSPPRDTNIKIIFAYDGQKRLSKLTEYRYSQTVPYNVIELAAEIRYQYNGTDTLPSLLLGRSVYLSAPPWYDTVRVSYLNGEIRRDSSAYGAIGGPPAYKLMNFNRTGSSTYSATFIDSVAGFTAYRRELRAGVNWQNGNLLSASDTIGSAILNYSYMYDTHPNPLRRTLFKFLSPGFGWNYPSDPVFGSWYLNRLFYTSTTNNIIFEQGPVASEIYSRQYEYLPNGYPKRMIYYLNGLPFSKIDFFYTSL